jgi:hypothetical protein
VLLIAKFVPGLDGIAPPLAGTLGTSRVAFLSWDAGGCVLVWYTSIVARVLLVILGLPLLLFFVWRLIELVHVARILRLMLITPEQLKARLDLGEKIGLLDLLRFEDDPQGARRDSRRRARRSARYAFYNGYRDAHGPRSGTLLPL